MGGGIFLITLGGYLVKISPSKLLGRAVLKGFESNVNINTHRVSHKNDPCVPTVVGKSLGIATSPWYGSHISPQLK